MSYPESMVQLIDEFAKLPGVGRRTAERFASYILSASKEDVKKLALLIEKVNESIHFCQTCFNLSEGPSCHICSDPRRDHSLLCVVQDPKDVIAIEKAGEFYGIYHVLQGVLSPLEGIGPKDIRIKELIQRIKTEQIKELILGTSSDTEGDATAIYVIKQLKSFADLKITRIAHGVPVGSALEFADKATLQRAFKQRQAV